MATQGLVTIQKNGEVVMKIVAGCDGMQAGTLASAIRGLDRVPGLYEAYDLALKVGFGSKENLVVLEKKASFHQCEEILSRRYRRTFKQPRFNPRWKYGTADHIQVVNL